MTTLVHTHIFENGFQIRSGGSFLTERSAYRTRARTELLDLLKNAPGKHFSAAEIMDHFIAENKPIVSSPYGCGIAIGPESGNPTMKRVLPAVYPDMILLLLLKKCGDASG